MAIGWVLIAAVLLFLLFFWNVIAATFGDGGGRPLTQAEADEFARQICIHFFGPDDDEDEVANANVP